VDAVSSDRSVAGHLAWCTTAVDGLPAHYGTAGSGLPVLFIHGWALGHQTYKRALKRLVQQGCQVVAPALPGFAGTPNLPDSDATFAGYAGWVARFLDRLGYDEPVVTVGHSFGGGVAVKLAADHPQRVRQLVLVNSIGGSTWRARGQRVKLMAERPLWDWGLRFPTDLWPPTRAGWVVPFVRDDLLRNVVLNPVGTWRAATLARAADLTVELETVRRSGVPVLAISGRDDQVIPRDSFGALCAALGCEGRLVAGRHAWLLTDPDSFAGALEPTIRRLQAGGDTLPAARLPGPGAGRRAAS
jgi:pimeloyl-ACP methyl ester carboxylesterase